MTAEGGAEIPGRPLRGTDWPRARSPNPYTLRWRTPRCAGCACAPAASERGRRRATQSRSRVRACVCVCVRVSACARTHGPRLPAPRTPPAARSPAGRAASPGMQSWCRGTSHSRGLSADIQSAWAPEGPGRLGQPPAALTCAPITGDRWGGRKGAGGAVSTERSAQQRGTRGRGSREKSLGVPGGRDGAGSVGTVGDRETDRQTRRRPGPQSRFPRGPLTLGSLLSPRTQGRVCGVGSQR